MTIPQIESVLEENDGTPLDTGEAVRETLRLVRVLSRKVEQLENNHNWFPIWLKDVLAHALGRLPNKK